MHINKLLDLEKDLREAEYHYATGIMVNGGWRGLDWIEELKENGFFVDGKFLPIIDIVRRVKDSGKSKEWQVFMLESIGSDLSLLLNDFSLKLIRDEKCN